jgi:DNA-binding response OmpR family regulator
MARSALIIEHDEGLARALARNLRLRGFLVSIASSVGQGLDMLVGIDVVVLQLVLPDAPGTVVLRKIRRENLPIRVAILTNADDPRMIAEIVALGPDAVIHTLEIDKLLDWVIQP